MMMEHAATAETAINDTDLARQAARDKSIVLVGLMGAGKTSVGRRLAEKLGLDFIDADHEIEAAAGQTIAEIFANHGETYFREGERRVIARLLENGNKILATGGGAFMNAETRAAIKQGGVSVWLKADLELLLKRVQKRDNRPLLKGKDPREVLGSLIELRYPVYETADIIVESRDAQHAETVNDVVRALAVWSLSQSNITASDKSEHHD
jgi:shikimate kinase